MALSRVINDGLGRRLLEMGCSSSISSELEESGLGPICIVGGVGLRGMGSRSGLESGGAFGFGLKNVVRLTLRFWFSLAMLSFDLRIWSLPFT